MSENKNRPTTDASGDDEKRLLEELEVLKKAAEWAERTGNDGPKRPTD